MKEYLQNHGYYNQKLPIPSQLFAIVHLLPPSQSVVHSLVVSKGSSLLPMEEVVSDLKHTDFIRKALENQKEPNIKYRENSAGKR